MLSGNRGDREQPSAVGLCPSRSGTQAGTLSVSLSAVFHYMLLVSLVKGPLFLLGSGAAGVR